MVHFTYSITYKVYSRGRKCSKAQGYTKQIHMTLATVCFVCTDKVLYHLLAYCRLHFIKIPVTKNSYISCVYYTHECIKPVSKRIIYCRA